jgi:sec-independent protein translocase protein TatB
MFDVGFSELLIIAVVALIVLGPERLPKAARFAGLWVRRARAQWYSVKAELERELAQEDMKKQFGDPLAQMRPTVEALRQDLKESFDGLDPGLPARVELQAPADAAVMAPMPASTPPDASAPTTEASAPAFASETAPGAPTDPAKP